MSSEALRQETELNRLMGRRAVWRPFIPQRTVLNEAVGERAPVHALGYRGRDTADVFDALYRKLARVTARPSSSTCTSVRVGQPWRERHHTHRGHPGQREHADERRPCRQVQSLAHVTTTPASPVPSAIPRMSVICSADVAAPTRCPASASPRVTVDSGEYAIPMPRPLSAAGQQPHRGRHAR